MFKKIKRFLDFNLRYLGDPPWDTGVSPPELINFLQTAEPGRALDLGCGSGTNLLTLAKKGWTVVGVDMALIPVLRARAKLREASCQGRVIRGDVTSDLELRRPFDFVLDIGCYHALTPQGRSDYRQKLKTRLKPGGTYLLYAHNRTSPEDSHGIVEADLNSFQAFLSQSWRKDNQEKRPDGGGGRPSTWVRFDRNPGGQHPETNSVD